MNEIKEEEVKVAGNAKVAVSPEGEVSQTEDFPTVTIADGKAHQMRPTVIEAVKQMRPRAPKLRANGIFRHPPDWTEEELNYIADCLKLNIPIYTIAGMVHCERGALSRLIHRTPMLRQLKEEQHENMLDEAEYQADRLMKAGNSSMVMFVLQTLGKKRGWTTEEVASNEEGEQSRIIMGCIPDSEVAAAEKMIQDVREGREAKSEQVSNGNEREQVKPKTSGSGMINPMELAIIEDKVKEEVAIAVEASKPKAIDVESYSVSDPPYESELMSDEVGLGQHGWSYTDPWAAGADSPFGI